MVNTLDLTAYLDRVNWHGPTERTYATLAGLLDAHIAHIPFENFDVLLGRPVRLDLEGSSPNWSRVAAAAIASSMPPCSRLCSERLGFEPVRHAARVTVFQPLSEAARTHMFLSVELDGARFVIDPGFGPFGSNLPVPLDGVSMPVDRSNTPDGSRRRSLGDARHPRWGGNSRVGFHPRDPVSGRFRNGQPFHGNPSNLSVRQWILASAVTGEGRVNVMNRDVTVLRRGTVEKSILPDRSALRLLLVKHFGFDLPEAETMRVPSVPDWR